MIDLQLNVGAQSIPFVSEWYGPWALESRAAMALAELVSRSNIAEHLGRVQSAAAADTSPKARSKYRTDIGNVAVLSISGVLMKQEPSLMAGTSTVSLRREVRAIAQDGNIGCVLLAIDSPGGSASGLDELASDISKLSMPVHAFASDMCCSAAYLLACCSEYISSERAAAIGSIGTYLSVIDSSAAAATNGLRVHLIKSEGAIYKGTGTPGVPISDEQLKNLQSIVDSHQSRFNERVANGRKMSMTKAKVLADGAIYDANGAKAQGLIDAIGNWDEALAKAQQAAAQYRSGKPTTGGKPNMSTSDNPLKAWNDAIATEMAAQNCDKQTAAYRIRRRHPEMATAAREYANAHQAQAAQPEASQGENPYWAMVKEYQAKGKSRSEAQKLVNSKHPELREHARC